MALLTVAVVRLAVVPAQAPVQLPDDGIGTSAPLVHPHTSPRCREVGKPGWRLGAGVLMGLGLPGQRRAGPNQTKLPARPVGTCRCRLRGSQPTREPQLPPLQLPCPGGTQAASTAHLGSVSPARDGGGCLGGQQPPSPHQRGHRDGDSSAVPKQDLASPLAHGGGGGGGDTRGLSPTHAHPGAGTVPTSRLGLALMGFTISSNIPLKMSLGRGAPPSPPASPPRPAKLFLIKTSPGLSITVPLRGTPAPGGGVCGCGRRAVGQRYIKHV